MTDHPETTGLENPRLAFGLTLLIALVALFWQLGVRGLNEPDEGRYASVAAEMLRSGDWVVPHFQGQPHLTKPPLIYWLTALNLKLFGVNEWAARLAPAWAALGTLLLTWSLGRRFLGPRYALYAALLLLTSPLFFVVARLCDPNMLLTLWITLGSWAWLGWQQDGRPAQRLLYYLAHGLAFLTKGPVGCVVILLGQLAFRRVSGRALTTRRIWWWPGILLALGVGLSWYMLMIAQQPDRLDYFLRYELFDRVFTNTHKRSEPFFFFWVVLPAAFLPWLPVFSTLRTRGWTSLRASFPEAGLLLHLFFILLLFTLSRSKLPTYILPALPPLALLTAAQMRFDEARGRHFRSVKRLVALISVLLPIILIYVGHARFHSDHWLHGSTLLSLGATTVLLWRMKRCPQHRWLLPAAGLLLVSYFTLLDVVRRHERAMFGESTKDLMQEWQRHQPDPAYLFYYTHAPAGLGFYLQGWQPALRLPLVKTGERLSSEDYVQQLTHHLMTLRGQPAYVMASSYHLNKVPGAVEQLPAQVLAQDRKYTLLFVR